MRHFSLLSLVLLAGCTPEEEVSDAPTYWADIVPILDRSCISCHQDAGIAPFALDNAEFVSGMAGAIQAATANRSMPPFLVTDDGTCGDYAGAGWLTEAELDTIAQWADAGAPEGDASEATDSSSPAAGLDRVDVDVTITPYTPEVPEGGGDDYRCFLIENDSETDVFLTAYEGVPDQTQYIHHMTAYAVNLESDSYAEGFTNGEVLGGLQAASDGRGGWPCFGAAGDGVRHSGIPAVWAPGQGVVEYPEGVGYAVHPGEEFVLQIHYHVEGDGPVEPDASGIHFRTAPAVERLAWFSAPDDFLLSYIYETYGMGQAEEIPPGEAAWQFSFPFAAEMALADGGLDPSAVDSFSLVGVMPHMHGYGKRQWLRHNPEDEDTCTMEVRYWDVHWQRFYFYDEPVLLDPSDTLEITCEWDTTGATAPVGAGWGIDEEMCLVTMMFVHE